MPPYSQLEQLLTEQINYCKNIQKILKENERTLKKIRKEIKKEQLIQQVQTQLFAGGINPLTPPAPTQSTMSINNGDFDFDVVPTSPANNNHKQNKASPLPPATHHLSELYTQPSHQQPNQANQAINNPDSLFVMEDNESLDKPPSYMAYNGDWDDNWTNEQLNQGYEHAYKNQFIQAVGKGDYATANAVFDKTGLD